MEVLKVELKKVDNEVLQVSIREQLKQAYQSSEEDLAYVEEEFSNFCRNQQLKKALMSSIDLLKVGDYEAIRFMVDNALKAGQDKNVGLDDFIFLYEMILKGPFKNRNVEKRKRKSKAK